MYCSFPEGGLIIISFDKEYVNGFFVMSLLVTVWYDLLHSWESVSLNLCVRVCWCVAQMIVSV